MHVVTARNVHQALPQGIRYLRSHGVRRDSRNGPVLVAPNPVTTEYRRPTERLVFWPQRDVNAAFLLYESLWMLAGRNDLAPLTRYIKEFGRYSDDGVTLHGAYGHRWRVAFGDDQLAKIARRLAANVEDRRAVLQIWDAQMDLDVDSKDLPCNDTVTFQRNADGELDMVVFNRSNDIIWGAYFANAAHFSMLQEYLACWIGCPVGRYWQVSTNYHAYVQTLEPLLDLPERAEGVFSVPNTMDDPYADWRITPVALADGRTGPDAIEWVDDRIAEVLMHAETGFALPRVYTGDSPWFDMVCAVLRAHELWRHKRPIDAMMAVGFAPSRTDFGVSMAAWLTRRAAAVQHA